MSDTPDLFDDPPPPRAPVPIARHTDPETSHQAAADATPRASHGRLLVLRNLLRWGAQTDYELAADTGWQQNSIGKRRGECVQMGLVEAATIMGEQMKRPAPSGSLSMCWRITTKGLAFLQANS